MEVEKMKNKKKPLAILFVLCVLIINGFSANIALGTSTHDSKSGSQEDKILDTPETSQGEASFGIFYAEAQNADGFPDTFYAGALTNINATLYDVTMLAVVPIPLVIFSSILENEDIINLNMDFFWGVIDKTPDEGNLIAGFGRSIKWEW